MKTKTSIIATSLLCALIAISLNFTPTVVGTHTPSNVIQTGDRFTFTESAERDDSQYRLFLMYETTDGNLTHADEEYGHSYTLSEGEADVGFIRQRPLIPPLGEMDTVVVVQSYSESQPGSYREGYSNHSYNDQNQLLWQNNSQPVENTAGQRQGGDQQTIMLTSNATYSVIFPEVGQSTLNIFGDQNQGGNDNPFMNVGGFNGNVPLVSEVVYASTLVTDINGATYNLVTKVIEATFSGTWTETRNETVWLGDTFTQAEVTYSITITVVSKYVYDNLNTLLVQTATSSSIESSFNAALQNVTLTYPGGSTGPRTISHYFENSQTEDRTSTVSAAIGVYGVPRPLSSGSPRLTAGQSLVYAINESNEWWLDFHSNVNGPGVLSEETTTMSSYYHSEGDAIFDIFRHHPNSFEAVLILNGIASGEFNRNEYRNNNGDVNDPPAEHQVLPSSPLLGFDLFELPNDATHDIAPFFDDKKHVDTSFLYGDCNNGGNDDCFDIHIPNELNKDGAVNISSYYINLNEQTDGPGYLEINGFDFWEFNVEEHTQRYKLSHTATETRDFNDEMGGSQPVDLQISMQAESRQSFYYDHDTGAMIALSEGMYANLKITGSKTVSVPGGSLTFSININIEWREEFQLFLTEHPTLYGVAPTPPPTTSTSSSSSSETVDSSSQSADLPLPVPIMPILASFVVISILVRKRK